MFEREAAAARTSGSGAMACRVDGATGGEKANWGMKGAHVGQGDAGRPRGIVGPRWVEHGDDSDQSWAFGEGAGAPSVVIVLWASVSSSGRDGIFPVSISVWLRVRPAQVDQGVSLYFFQTRTNGLGHGDVEYCMRSAPI